MPAAQPMTARQYLSLPELEGRRTDLVEGEVVMNDPTVSPPTTS